METPEAFTDEGVAGVGARRDGGEGEARVERGGEIFERVDGDVDAAGGERLLDFFDEDALGIKRAAIVECRGCFKGGILHAVAGGADDLDRDIVAALTQFVSDVIGLPERELGAAGTNAEGGGGHRG